MAQACNPSTLGGRAGWITRSRDRDQPGQHGETPSLLKIQKISWAWWLVPVFPGTQEAEAGELPEPKIAPLHSSLGNKSETPSQNKQTNKQTRFNSNILKDWGCAYNQTRKTQCDGNANKQNLGLANVATGTLQKLSPACGISWDSRGRLLLAKPHSEKA